MWEEDDSSLQLLSDDELDNVEQVSPGTDQYSKSRQVLCPILPTASCVTALGGILFGYDIGIISGALLQLREDFDLSCRQQETIVTCLIIGGLLASIGGGFLVDWLGRKSTIITNALLFMAGAAVLASANSYYVLILGRLIVGFAVSLSAIGNCVYISEISPPAKRGLLVSLNELGITLGILLAFLVSFLFINSHNGWRFMFGISGIPALFQAVGMLFLPASPRWLINQQKEEKAKSVIPLLWPNVDIESELKKLKKNLSSERNYTIFDLFKSDQNMRLRMVIGCGIILFGQMTGQPTVLYYAPSVFESLGFHSRLSSTLATVGVGAVKFLSTAVTLVYVDKLGRRRFLIVGSTLMLICLIILSTVTVPLTNLKHPNTCHSRNRTMLNHKHPINCNTTGDSQNRNIENSSNVSETSSLASSRDISENQLPNCTQKRGSSHYDEEHKLHILKIPAVSPTIRYTSMISLMMFVVGFAISYGPMGWLILTEIFPTGIKGRAVATATIFNWGTNIMISATFLDLIDSVGVSYTFMMYAVCGFFAVVFIYHFVPETKQRTLEQVDEQLLNMSIRCGQLRCCEPRSRSLHLRLREGEDPTSILLEEDEFV